MISTRTFTFFIATVSLVAAATGCASNQTSAQSEPEEEKSRISVQRNVKDNVPRPNSKPPTVPAKADTTTPPEQGTSSTAQP